MNSLSDSRQSREEFLQRNLLFNLIAFLIDAGGFWLGMGFLSTQTILPYFVKQLGGNDFHVGLIPALTSLYLLPQLFAAPIVERRPIQRKAVLRIALLERFWLGLLIPLTLVFSRPAPKVMIACLLLCLTLNALTMGMNMPAYATLLTKVIPANKRGRLWGISGAIGGLIGIGGAKACSWLLQTYGMPLGFVLCFLIGVGVLFVTVIPLGYVREPEALDLPQTTRFRDYWAETRGLLRQRPGFHWIILAEMLFGIPWVAPAFYTAYAKDHFQATYASVGLFTMMQIVASVIGGFAWGFISDRSGNRRTLILSTLVMVTAPLSALLVPSLAWFPLVFFLSSLAGCGFDLGLFNILLEFGGDAKVATYQGVRGILVTPMKMAVPLLIGVLVSLWGYTVLFGVFLAAVFGTLLVLRAVPEPRHRFSHDVRDSPQLETAGVEN